MFLKELDLYVDYLKQEIKEQRRPNSKIIKGWKTYCDNLKDGIDYYKELVMKTNFGDLHTVKEFLENAEMEIKRIAGGIEKQQMVTV